MGQEQLRDHGYSDGSTKNRPPTRFYVDEELRTGPQTMEEVDMTPQNQQQGQGQDNAKNAAPALKFTAGNVTISAWAQEGQYGEFHNFTMQRSYKDENDEWQNSQTLGVNDIPRAIEALKAAYKNEINLRKIEPDTQ